MPIDWLNKLRYLLQTLAFCLVISAIQYLFRPDRSYELPLVYSLCIGTSIWALIDFGRHAFPSSAETGWPAGLAGMLLPVVAIMGGFLLGTLAADRWFGWSSFDSNHPSNLLASILITAMAGIASSYYFYSRSRQGYLETKMSEARRHASEARLRLLETQLEPHMLFNTLANLRALIDVDPARAQTMLDHLIAYLRATLGASRVGTHNLSAEFERLRDYLQLMAIRMGPRLQQRLELPPDLAGHKVPALLLQPIVENAIQHGLEPKVDGGQITVRASRQGPHLLLEVEDSGVGATGDLGHAPGFGLQQVRDRLLTTYGEHARLDWQAAPAGGVAVRLTLPLDIRPPDNHVDAR